MVEETGAEVVSVEVVEVAMEAIAEAVEVEAEALGAAVAVVGVIIEEAVGTLGVEEPLTAGAVEAAVEVVVLGNREGT